ncbi:MAG: class D sortase [Parahaliea sp.]
MRLVECGCYVLGVACLGLFYGQLALGEAARQRDIAAFTAQQQVVDTAQQRVVDVRESDDSAAEEASPLMATPAIDAGTLVAPDTRTWAPGRIESYRASLEQPMPSVLGVLQLPQVGLELPVYATSSELALDRGAGIIGGMAYPHEGGNIGIAGHRDGYFRALKDVAVGDHITLQTLAGAKRFTVEAMQIVDIGDTHILAETDQQRLTLVTCYPFYFVGHAPQRFVVTASLDSNLVN